MSLSYHINLFILKGLLTQYVSIKMSKNTGYRRKQFLLNINCEYICWQNVFFFFQEVLVIELINLEDYASEALD